MMPWIVVQQLSLNWVHSVLKIKMVMMMVTNLMTMPYIMTIFKIIDDQDDDCDCMTINLGQGHGNNCELDHLYDVDMSKGVDRGCDYDNNDKIDDNGDRYKDLEGPLGSYKEYIE